MSLPVLLIGLRSLFIYAHCVPLLLPGVFGCSVALGVGARNGFGNDGPGWFFAGGLRMHDRGVTSTSSSSAGLIDAAAVEKLTQNGNISDAPEFSRAAR